MTLFLTKYTWEITETIVLSAVIFFLLYYFIKKGAVKRTVLIVFSLCAIGLITVGLYRIFTPPEIELIGGVQINVEVFDSYNDSGITITDSTGKPINAEVSSDAFAVDTNVLGLYRVIYSFSYKNRSYSASRLVRVIDTVPPEISVIGKEVVTVERFEDYKEPGCKAEDNYDGDISESVSVSYSGDFDDEVKAAYTAEDSSGNAVQIYRTIKIKDITPPKVTLGGYESIIVIKGNKYEEKGAKAFDNRDGDITDKLKIDGVIDTDKTGTYIIKYSASDLAGNTGYKTREIKVVEPESVKGNIIYLTFDDGPSNSATKKILDVLKKNGVKATFFIINFDTKEKADLIKNMVAQGHTVAVHGYSHVYKDIYRSEKAFMDNTNSLRDKVKALTGYKPTIMRFPGGSSNTVSNFNPGIMTTLVKSVQDAGYIYFDWNVDSGDAAGGRVTADRLYDNVTAGLRKNRGNVVLMHDTGNGDVKAKAVQRIIDYGKAKGYVFAPITEATAPVHHPVRN